MRKSLSSSELRKILETTNERDLFMVGHIYIENTIDRILEKRFNIPSKILDNTRFITSMKIDILAESGLIKGNIKKNIGLICYSKQLCFFFQIFSRRVIPSDFYSNFFSSYFT